MCVPFIMSGGFFSAASSREKRLEVSMRRMRRESLDHRILIKRSLAQAKRGDKTEIKINFCSDVLRSLAKEIIVETFPMLMSFAFSDEPLDNEMKLKYFSAVFLIRFGLDSALFCRLYPAQTIV
jgi:hypothetical protein